VVPQYIYAKTEDDLYVNLFITSELKTEIAGRIQDIRLKSGFPQKGSVSLRILTEVPRHFTLHFRYPGWLRGQVLPSDLYRSLSPGIDSIEILLNGEKIDHEIIEGYCVIEREWTKGDAIQLHFPMKVQMVMSNENIEANRGKVAIQKGPLVFCAEQIDYQDSGLEAISIQPQTEFMVLDAISTSERIPKITWKAGIDEEVFSAIPYYHWANRGPGEMRVWIPYE
jgi:DUF1680 family protein